MTFALIRIKKQLEASPQNAPQAPSTKEPTACTSARMATIYEFVQSLMNSGKLRAQFS